MKQTRLFATNFFFEEMSSKYLLVFLILKISAESQNQENEDALYRLPTDLVQVEYYTIEITITNETLFGNHKFEGNTTIVFKNANRTNEIQLHFGKDMSLGKIQLSQRGKDFEIKMRNIDDLTEILTLQTKKALEKDVPCELRIEYDAVFYNDSFYGFHQNTYFDEDGNEKILGATKFGPYYAHQAFACFDEPQYKATFDLTIKHPKEYTVVSNTRKVEDFEQNDPNFEISIFLTTPKMSTYLLAFVISNLTCTQREEVKEAIVYSVCSRPGTEDMRELALDFAPKVIKFLENFTDLGYNNLTGIHKIDQVALPETNTGAMENWGLVTYSEPYLLWDPENFPNRQKQQVLKAIAHELAHFWFGNLVTIDWWSNLFLGEGLVSYLGYHISSKIDPSLELDKQFVIYDLQMMLYQDSFKNTLPLNAIAPTPDKVLEKFGAISYAKGAAIFRMIHHAIGEDNFKKGLRRYLDKYKFGNASPEDLWAEFEEYENLGLLVENWVSKPGYPVVYVAADSLNITLTQEKFTTEKDVETNEIDFWYIPISFTISVDSDKFNDTTAEFWMPPEKEFELDSNEDFDWIILNNQQTGFFRVNYDDQLWEKIEVALNKPDFDGIHELNRAQILDDFFVFTNKDLKNISQLLDLYKFLKNDTSYYSWYPAFRALAMMLDKTATKELRSTFLEYIRDLMTAFYKSVDLKKPKNDDQMYSLKREMAVTGACEFGFQDCIDNCVEAFEIYRETKIKPDPNLRETIFCYGLRHSKKLKNDWDLMFEELKTAKTEDEQKQIFRVLGCPKNKEILTNYLHKIFDPESDFDKSDQVSAISTIFNNRPEGFEVVLDFIIDNHDLEELPTYLYGFYSRFTTRTQTDKFQHFLNTTDMEYLTKMVMSAGLEQALYIVNNIEKFEEDLKLYFGIRSKKESVASTLATGLAIVVAYFIVSYKFLL